MIFIFIGVYIIVVRLVIALIGFPSRTNSVISLWVIFFNCSAFYWIFFNAIAIAIFKALLINDSRIKRFFIHFKIFQYDFKKKQLKTLQPVLQWGHYRIFFIVFLRVPIFSAGFVVDGLKCLNHLSCFNFYQIIDRSLKTYHKEFL